MRFVDSNVFVYAIFKPKRKLTKEEEEIKNKAKKIYQRIIKSEEVIT